MRKQSGFYAQKISDWHNGVNSRGTLYVELLSALGVMALCMLVIMRFQAHIHDVHRSTLQRLHSLQSASSCMEQCLVSIKTASPCEAKSTIHDIHFSTPSGEIMGHEEATLYTVCISNYSTETDRITIKTLKPKTYS